MTWKVHWDDVIVIPNARTRGSMYSLVANKFRGSQLVNMREGDCNSRVKSLRKTLNIVLFAKMIFRLPDILKRIIRTKANVCYATNYNG